MHIYVAHTRRRATQALFPRLWNVELVLVLIFCGGVCMSECLLIALISKDRSTFSFDHFRCFPVGCNGSNGSVFSYRSRACVLKWRGLPAIYEWKFLVHLAERMCSSSHIIQFLLGCFLLGVIQHTTIISIKFPTKWFHCGSVLIFSVSFC